MKEYGIIHREQISLRQKKYNLLNREKVLAQGKKSHLKNRDKRNAASKNYRETHKEEFRLMKKRWNQANLKHIAKRLKERRRKDAHLRLATCLRTRLRKSLKGASKSAHTIDLLGCSLPALRLHLEQRFQPGMTWVNYGPVWHVDHVKPCASFDLTDPAQQRECFHFTNLQPLFARDNLVKGARQDAAAASRHPANP